MDLVGELQRTKARLQLIQAQLEVEIGSLDALIAEATEEKPEGCPHKNRAEVTGMGAERRSFICHDCGEIIEGPLPDEGAH
ncbi:MAG: hypothetical protein WC375_07920 [Methanomassiliicoccales archaeon]|jgi:transposase-like protein